MGESAVSDLSIYDVRKIFGFLDPLPPLVTYRNQLILFLLYEVRVDERQRLPGR